MSLRGKTVVVTRAIAQAPELAERLEAKGARVVALPCLELDAPADPAPLARAAADGAYDWIVFVSRNAAERTLASAGARAGRAKIAAVGAGTARFLEGAGWPVALVPAEARSEGLLEALGEVTGLRVLVPRAPEGRALLVESLEARGARVDAPEAYRLRPAPAPSAEALEAARGADVVTFMSGKTLEHFLAIVPGARELLSRVVVAVVGPVAEARASALGVRVDVVPREASVEALADALDVL